MSSNVPKFNVPSTVKPITKTLTSSAVRAMPIFKFKRWHNFTIKPLAARSLMADQIKTAPVLNSKMPMKA